MITEDYVSFETAKLLKGKGFDVCCMAVYSLQGQFNNPASVFSLKNNEFIYAPTLQLAMKWLREVHKLSIELYVDYGLDDESWWSVDVGKIKKGGLIDALTGYRSYEEACEAAIKYCLENLI